MLKNNTERRRFVEDYESWESEDKALFQYYFGTIYKKELPDGWTVIVIEQMHSTDYPKPGTLYNTCTWYLIPKEMNKPLEEYRTSITELVYHIKGIKEE